MSSSPPHPLCSVFVLAVFTSACASRGPVSPDASVLDAHEAGVTPDAAPDLTWTDALEPDAALEAATPDAALDLTWRSALYPDDWRPDFEDSSERFLHDFSYAGYHKGEIAPGAACAATETFDVTTFGADDSGAVDATDAIVDAIAAACAAGGIVFFPAGLYRVDEVLEIACPNVILRGEGPARSRLYFSRSEAMDGRGHITFQGRITQGTQARLVEDAPSRGTEVWVDDAGDLAVGDDVSVGWTVTDDFIAEHNMTGTWRAFNGTWQPMFRRTVVAIDRSDSVHRVTLDVPLRSIAKVRDGASLRRETGYLREVGVESLGLSNAVDLATAWGVRLVSVLRFDGVADGWVANVETFASPLSPTSGPAAGAHVQSNGVSVYGSKRVTIADSSVGQAENRGGGGNGYLFEVSQSSEVLFRDLVARGGRHNFIQNWGFGTTGCVWLRVHSVDSLMEATLATAGLGFPGYSDFHHSLATANLVDSARIDDGLRITNRGDESSGAGITGTENVIWNVRGTGTVISMQFAYGYVIGTTDVSLITTGIPWSYEGTAPDDFVEGQNIGASLAPESLYEDQLMRRLSR